MLRRIKTKKKKSLTASEMLDIHGGKCIFACGCTCNCGTAPQSSYLFNISQHNTEGVPQG